MERASEANAVLSSPDRTRYLAVLAEELALAGRATYRDDAISPNAAITALRCLNELQLVVAKQLRTDVGSEETAYPDAAFVDVLNDKARTGGCLDSLTVAERRARQRLQRSSTDDIGER